MTDIVHLSDSVKLLIGDCRESLRSLPDGSVHCCITSPPYWGLRDYGTAQWEGGDPACDHKDDAALAERLRQKKSMIACGERMDGSTRTRIHDEEIGKTIQYRDICRKCGARRIDSQIGLERTPEAYVAEMVAVFREVRRVLRDDATLWLVLGDSFASGKGTCYNPGGGVDSLGQNRKTAGAHPLDRGNKSSLVASGLKPKDLVGIPWRVAFALQADGWWLRQDIIWSKPNPMPESVTDRCTKAHEYIFLLTKSARYYYDAEAVKEAATKAPDKKPSASKYEGDDPRYATKQGIIAARCKDYREVGRNRRSVWTIATHPLPEAHFATFPPKLIEPCILAGTSERGCCPKCGKPWERVVETPQIPDTLRNRGPDTKMDFHTRQVGGGQKIQDWRDANPAHTVGWRPGCSCGGDPVPCTILDCFSGAGTTGLVAIRHGRRYIGCELNPDYIEMTRKRLSPELAQGRLPL